MSDPSFVPAAAVLGPRDVPKSTGAYAPDKALAWPDRLQALRRGEQPYPVHLHLIISDLCSLNCPLCAYRLEGYSSNELFSERDALGKVITNNPNRMLEMPLVESILADFVAMGGRAVEFSVWGQERIPLVTPEGRTETRAIGAFVDSIFGTVAEGLHESLDTRGRGWFSHAIDDGGRVVRGEIEAVYRHRAIEPLLEITLAGGRSCVVTRSHSLNAVRDGQIVKVPAGALTSNDRIATATWRVASSLPARLPVPSYEGAKDWNVKDVPDDIVPSATLFRLLGYYTAEGSSQKGNLLWVFGNGPREDTYREDVLRCIREALGVEGKRQGSRRISLSSVRIVEFLRSLGALGVQQDRQIPWPVWAAPAEWKLEYLRGLFSGDGCYRTKAQANGHFRNSLHLKTCNRGLAQDVAMLLRQIGARASVSSGQNGRRKIEGRELPATPYHSVDVYDKDSLQKLQPVLDGLDARPLYRDSIYSFPGAKALPGAAF